MYPHHEESIQKLLEYYKPQEGVIAIILGGSVPKGLARPDSDIDAMVIVTPERYKKHEAEDHLMECISGYCTYPEGYFDVKFLTKDFIKDAADKGSEPARNAFLCARCLYSIDPEIPGIVERIPVYQKQEKADKQLSFYAALNLNMGYFWDMSKHDNPYLKLRAVADIILFGYRLLLAENEVLFPCQKALVATVEKLPRKPEGIIEKGNRLMERMDDESKKDFVDSILNFIQYTPPTNMSEILTRFCDDNEKWWRNGRPNVIEW